MSTKRIFVTGVTGYIGGSIAARLVEAGYQVTGLARKAADAPRLQALGITPVQGALEDLPLLMEQAGAADAVIDTADADNAYVAAAFLQALENTGKIFIRTSGSSIVGDKAAGAHGPQARHAHIPEQPALEKAARVAIDREVIRYAQRGVHTVVICPTMIYGAGLGLKKDSIQVPLLTAAARRHGAGVFIGKGANVWSNVHINDLTNLYLLALEKAPAGSFYFAENGEAALADIGNAISRQLGFGGKTKELTLQEAVGLWGLEGAYFGLGSNSLVSAAKARQELGWAPEQNNLLDLS